MSYYLIRVLQEIIRIIDRTLYLFKKKKNYIEFDLHMQRRINNKTLKRMEKSIEVNNKYLAGNTVIFKTNSRKIQIEILYNKQEVLKNMSLMGSSGIDVYRIDDNGEEYLIKGICPRTNCQMYINDTIYLNELKNRIRIYLPLYAQIRYIRVSCDSESYILKEKEKKINDAIAFYGSSITQGCAASRPSLSYTNIVSRRLNLISYNFGYSESAKGQIWVIKEINRRKYKYFVMEFDHNASIEELENRHYQVYKEIRNNDNDVIIIIMSRFSGGISISEEEENIRRKIILKTIDKARAQGDEKLIFIDGKDSLAYKRDCFVDDRHPNDYGMQQIANMIIDRINEMR